MFSPSERLTLGTFGRSHRCILVELGPSCKDHGSYRRTGFCLSRWIVSFHVILMNTLVPMAIIIGCLTKSAVNWLHSCCWTSTRMSSSSSNIVIGFYCFHLVIWVFWLKVVNVVNWLNKWFLLWVLHKHKLIIGNIIIFVCKHHYYVRF